MNENNNKVAMGAGIVVVVIIIVGLFVWAQKGSNSSDSLEVTPTPISNSTSGSNNQGGSGNPVRSPLPANTLALFSPVGGEFFTKGQLVKISWDSSVDLSNAKIVITLLKAGKVISTLSEAGGVDAFNKEFSWAVPDLSLWGEEGFSIQINTTGLSPNLKAESGSFNAS